MPRGHGVDAMVPSHPDLGFGHDACALQGFEMAVEDRRYANHTRGIAAASGRPQCKRELCGPGQIERQLVSVTVKLALSFPDLLLDISLSLPLRDDSSSVPSTSQNCNLFGNGILTVSLAAGEDVGYKVSESIRYGLGMFIE